MRCLKSIESRVATSASLAATKRARRRIAPRKTILACVKGGRSDPSESSAADNSSQKQQPAKQTDGLQAARPLQDTKESGRGIADSSGGHLRAFSADDCNAALSGVRPDARVMFAIPPAALFTPTNEVLQCMTMRGLLGEPRPSPLQDELEDIWEGKYVSDDDRVALNVMDFASPASTGAHSLTYNVQQQLQHKWMTESQQQATTPTDSSSSGHLALSSGLYGAITSSTSSYDSLGSSLASGDSMGGTQQVCLPLPPFAVRAGPRDEIYFDPKTITAAIVTTGNLCPGMNDVIESMVKRLHNYGVAEDNILGIRYGIRGFNAKDAKPVVLTNKIIDGIHLTGGTILGTSNAHRMHHHHHRKHHHHLHTTSGSSSSNNGSASTTLSESDEDDPSSSSSSSSKGSPLASALAGLEDQDAQLEAILDKLDFWRINILCVIGGQGGNQLGARLAAGCKRRGIPCCVVGVPKSIDNDVMLVDKTFGFDTVVQEVVQRPLQAAKIEAASARKGIGLVKVFGRRSGFIALQASLASGAVDVCLIPEEPFELDGPAGLLNYLKQLVEKQGHAVICVSEGAGQDILYPGGEEPPLDESGNPKLKDIGAALKKAIKGAIPDADIKYIDPTYMIQAVPCNAQDHIYCRVLGSHAIDAAMAGYTGVTVGQVNGHFVLLPSSVITMTARRVDPKGKSWNRLRASIGQPRFQNNSPTDMPLHAVAATQGKVVTTRRLPGM